MPGKPGWPCGRFCWRAHRAARRRRCCDPVRVRHSDLCRRRVLAFCSARARQMQIEKEREREMIVSRPTYRSTTEKRIELEVRYTHTHTHMQVHLTRRPRPDWRHIKNSGFLFGFGLIFLFLILFYFFHDLLICIFEKKKPSVFYNRFSFVFFFLSFLYLLVVSYIHICANIYKHEYNA